MKRHILLSAALAGLNISVNPESEYIIKPMEFTPFKMPPKPPEPHHVKKRRGFNGYHGG